MGKIKDENIDFQSITFNEVLKQQGKFIELLSDLNKDFNGNVFKWETEAIMVFIALLSVLSMFKKR